MNVTGVKIAFRAIENQMNLFDQLEVLKEQSKENHKFWNVNPIF